MKPPTTAEEEGIGALHKQDQASASSETGISVGMSTSANSSAITKPTAIPATTNGERLESSKSPISTSTYRETSATPSSNYQDSETTYYELCPHELRVDHENDDQIVIQNLCNRKHEKLNKPCQNGFCYCFTSDSDEVRFSQTTKTNPKFRHRPRKQHQNNQQNSLPTNSANNTIPFGIGCINSANNDALYGFGKKKISSLAARTQNISPPMPVSSASPISQDGSSGIIEQTTINTSNHKNNTIVKSHRIVRPRLNTSSIVKSRLRETFDSDPNAPLVRIIQEIHKNVVISEVRINRDKIKCTRHNLNDKNTTDQQSSIESGQQTADEKVEFLIKEKTTKIPTFADKKTQTDSYGGRDSDSRSSSRTGGGRLLLKRIGSDAALKLKNSQDPPRKPPRRRFSGSSQSTKFTETISPILLEKATSPINIKLLDSPSQKYRTKNNDDDDDDEEKFKKNPYRKLRESLPSEKEIPNYQKASPSCPTLSELSSANTTIAPLTSNDVVYDDTEKDSNNSTKIGSSYGEDGKVPNIGWVRPEIVNMIHYEARGNAKDFHTIKIQPEPQHQQQQMGWTMPPKKDIDTVDNVKLNRRSEKIASVATMTNNNHPVEDEFNNFASSMESKSTPIKSQILSQSNVSNTSNNRSFIKGKLLNKLSTNSPLRSNKRSLGEKEQDVSIIPFTQNKDKVIKTTTFRKKATQNTRNFFESSKKKFVRFVFGNNNKEFNNINNNNNDSNDSGSSDVGGYKNGKTVATQTFESELMNPKTTSALSTTITTATTTLSTATATNITHHTFVNPIQQSISIYPSIAQNQIDSLSQQGPLSTQPSSLLSSVDNFDFSRKIDSPKKPERTFQRKLKFSPRKAFKHFGTSGSSVGAGGSAGTSITNEKQAQQFETYKSYDADLINNDFKIAAMNDILASLRSKLETTDEPPLSSSHHVVNAGEVEGSSSMHYHDHHDPDRHHEIHNHNTTSTTIHEDFCEGCSSTVTGTTNTTALNQTKISARADIHSEPIYSEIEDQQKFIEKDPSNRSLNEVTHIIVNNDPNVIYAEVHKIPKNNVKNGEQIKSGIQSFANMEIQKPDEYVTLPEQQQYCHQCYKVDNLALKVGGGGGGRSSSSSNHDLDQDQDSRHPESDVVSYDEPDESASYRPEFDHNSLYDGGEAASSSRKVGPDELKICRLKLDENISQISEKSFRCNSCPLPRSKYENLLINSDNNNLGYQRNVESENDFPTTTNNNNNNNNDNDNEDNGKKKSNRNFKDRLKLSFRRGKRFFKNETKRLSNVIDKNIKRIDSRNSNNKLWDQSDLCISQLYATEILNVNYNNDNNNTDDQKLPSVTNQIEKAVSICRQMPQFESSTELVEAERLLLFSSLKRELSDLRKYKPPPSIIKIPSTLSSKSPQQQPSNSSFSSNKSRIQINSFEIPIKTDGNYDMFFNYFYIGVFVNGTVIKSTQSVEKRNDLVIFSNCNIFFDNLEPNFGIRCYVYVLRLRKLCNLNMPQKPKRQPRKIISNSSDSGDEMISRFRLQGSFIIIAPNFAPYQIDEEYHDYISLTKSNNILNHNDENEDDDENNKIHLHAFNTCVVPLTTMSRSTNLCKEVKITANIELIFPKFELRGFLNVEDKNNRHNWNQRWCKLDTLKLCFWDYPQDCNEKDPILIVNLIKCISYPIEIANREVCARPKSFSIQIAADHDQFNDDDKSIETYFLSTDNQKDLNYWINGLNKIIEFVRIWMC